jgi:pimeloyl-ACP methyl ester carboxylesterase
VARQRVSVHPQDIDRMNLGVTVHILGFFMACLVAHHINPPPAAILSITGISTFRHPFFNSAILLTPAPITDVEMSDYLKGPLEVGETTEYDRTAFNLNQLLPSGSKNPAYAALQRPSDVTPSSKWDRGALYDYYLYRDAFVDLTGDVDPGFEWVKGNPEKLASWPPTSFIQGTDDDDVSMDVTRYAAESLGPTKAKLYLAEGQGHLFEATFFLEDDKLGMDAVRQAVACLDQAL